MGEVQKIYHSKIFITAKSTTEREARELVDYIWKYKIKSTWWNWWLSSPVHRWLKRTVFILLLGPILSIILYLFIPASMIPINLDRSIYVLFVLISIFFLLSPNIQSIRAEGIEVELRSPPPLEPMFSPLRMEEGIRKFEEPFNL